MQHKTRNVLYERKTCVIIIPKNTRRNKHGKNLLEMRLRYAGLRNELPGMRRRSGRRRRFNAPPGAAFGTGVSSSVCPNRRSRASTAPTAVPGCGRRSAGSCGGAFLPAALRNCKAQVKYFAQLQGIYLRCLHFSRLPVTIKHGTARAHSSNFRPEPERKHHENNWKIHLYFFHLDGADH